MTQSDTAIAIAEADSGGAEGLLLEGDLSPAMADEVRLQAIDVLEAARVAGRAVPVGIDSVDPSTTAIQLLVAVGRTAERDEIALEYSDNARTVLAALEHGRNEDHAE